MVMGVEHIFSGPDHMLFIVALLLLSTSFWPLVKTLTGFTIAHSITLILSALSVVVLDNRLVDIVVALSIIFVGLENIFWKDAARHRFWVAAGFGLIHGFGFSYTLREIGLPEQGLAWSLLSFNLGVEIAQVLLCAIAFPLLLKLRRRLEDDEQYGGMGWPKAMHLASWGVVAMGGYWLIERIAA
jgi:hydrogenase/urease accessory protein HupE